MIITMIKDLYSFMSERKYSSRIYNGIFLGVGSRRARESRPLFVDRMGGGHANEVDVTV